ncbi:hypothetical protein TcG_11770 [Trypanosoma cruzi]|nr:hypothetical protein TcG_11770 [Trypanosoma cruzi]
MQALCVFVCRCHATTSQQTCCDSVTSTSLWSSRATQGTAHIDALSGRSEASFEAQQGTGCVDAATTCMEFHDGTVSCGWWNIYFSEATERERTAAPAAGVVAAFCGLPCRLLSVC